VAVGVVVHYILYSMELLTSPSAKQDLLTVHPILTIKTHKTSSLLKVIRWADKGTHYEDDDSNGNCDNEEILSLENYVNNDKN
jgi:hypothetical protein